MYGNEFPLEDDNEILKLNSPKQSCRGPFVCVGKDLSQRWAVVALEWDNSPELAMRWFTGGIGTPASSGRPLWCILPNAFHDGVINGINLPPEREQLLKRFLNGEISGTDLRDGWS